ncbi:acyl-homoserine-lactone synthase [Tropicibacter naphthalenivorans]|uniref:Acyl-homoserine-lactone synthase n=1 Tax=Tropicibacter naphthalenivorans TaxID=441103 RepID=A0A0N7M0G1_9RHOB|nr:acyl-homoserine-lactone synthase [Tropicibacter naphthalenivorans]CUH80369.1 Acyl-homoserine-lactone synthase [Tropicibacter naphthalenivorans]SMC85986.1 N-acyl-L-homoserine lactone synthetase [Tropicibacter naphthalenivorans]
MIIVVDGVNRDRYTRLLDEMFALRARVFGGRLGWEVDVRDGKEIDQFDHLDPAYVIGVNDAGRVVSCVRALQTTGPHMLSDVFSSILAGEPPLRSPTIWESTRFCVDTEALDRGKSRNSVGYATCELMAASLQYCKDSGITDIVTVIDPVMNRVLKRSDCAPYDYVGETVPMGKVPAMAALLDCTDERIEKIKAFAGIEGDMFVDEATAQALADPADAPAPAPIEVPQLVKEPVVTQSQLAEYCMDQVLDAHTAEELEAAQRLASALAQAGMIHAGH